MKDYVPCLSITGEHASPRLLRSGGEDFFGAYTVRYHFVISGFLVAETENLEGSILLGRALEGEGPNLFYIGRLALGAWPSRVRDRLLTLLVKRAPRPCRYDLSGASA